MRAPALMISAIIALILAVPASACPDNQSDTMFGCIPNIGGSVGDAWEHLKREGQAETAGEPLAVWIQQSHDATERGGTQLVPPAIRQALTGYIDPGILSSARFVIGDPGAINAAHVIEQWNGQVAAVTLIDIIVFRNVWDAYNNPSLWAHELTHVKQYRDWGGVRNFAISYARDNGAVEREAYAVGDGYAAWAASHRQSYPVQQPSQLARICVTPQSSCPMAYAVPVGQSCSCVGSQGAFPGFTR